ncbi:MAG: RodZ domain-containing protein [Terriglobales bacterium]
MASFGAQLKQERERKGVTLEDISLTTKIGTRMLRALEEEHFDQLPGGIFNKGFIRAYARCLGMDEEQAIADYLIATGATPSAKKSENDEAPILEPPSREETPATAGLPWGTFAVVLLIVALGFAAWGFYSRGSEKEASESASPAPSATVANPPSTSPTAAAEQLPPEQKHAESADSSAPTSKPIEPPVATAAAIQPVPPAAVGPIPATSANSQPQPRVPANAPLLLVIKAREDSWLSISVDGEIVTRALLTAPALKSVRAQNEIVIKAGNVGALDFEFNGKKLPTQGDYGEVKTLTFSATGLQPPPPKPDPTVQSQ